MNNRIKILLIVLVLLVIADGLISKFLIQHGFASEGNPFLQPLIGEDIFLAVKAGGGLLAAVILWDIYRHSPKLSLINSIVFVIFYTVIVGWSLYIYFFLV